MAQNLVAHSKRPDLEVSGDGNGGLEHEISAEAVRKQAAELLAAGFHVTKVGKAMATYLNPTGNEVSAVKKLRRWMKRDAAFRDMIFDAAVIRLDLSSPQILNGIKNAAMRGRVDAARFALEVTGRHTAHEAPITQVSVVLNNIPRPEKQAEA
jgi:hypothetical protein